MRARPVTNDRWPVPRVVAALVAAVLLAGCTSTSTFVSISTLGAATGSGTSTGPITRTSGATINATSTSTAATTTTRSPAPAPQATDSAPRTALAVLRSLPVKGRAPETGYSRDRFGQAWSDDVAADGGHNGCDTRNDVLRRDLSPVTIKANTQGCVAASGTLHDPYTGHLIAFVRGEQTSVLVQIDHVSSGVATDVGGISAVRDVSGMSLTATS